MKVTYLKARTNRSAAPGGSGYLKVEKLEYAVLTLGCIFAHSRYRGKRLGALGLAAGAADHQGENVPRSLVEYPPPQRSGAALPSSRASLYATAIVSNKVS